MDLHTQLKNLADERAPGPVALDDIQLRARRLRRKASITNSAILLILIAVLVPGAANVLHQLRDETSSSRNDSLPREDRLVPPQGELTTPSSPSPSQAGCDKVDSCNEDEGLAHAPLWLGSALERAGLEYINDFRTDGGGGHFVKKWNLLIQVLRPTRITAEAQATLQEYDGPIWTHDSTKVFGSTRKDSPIAYFYWRAGGVDTFVEVVWAGSAADNIGDLESPINNVITAENEQPYFKQHMR